MTRVLFAGLLCDRQNYRLSIYAYTRSRQNEYLDTKPIITRHRNAPILKTFKSNFKVVDRSVYLQTAQIWNNMDNDTRNIDNIDTFIKPEKTDVGAYTTNYSMATTCNIESHFCYCIIISSSNIG